MKNAVYHTHRWRMLNITDTYTNICIMKCNLEEKMRGKNNKWKHQGLLANDYWGSEERKKNIYICMYSHVSCCTVRCLELLRHHRNVYYCYLCYFCYYSCEFHQWTIKHKNGNAHIIPKNCFLSQEHWHWIGVWRENPHVKGPPEQRLHVQVCGEQAREGQNRMGVCPAAPSVPSVHKASWSEPQVCYTWDGKITRRFVWHFAFFKLIFICKCDPLLYQLVGIG